MRYRIWMVLFVAAVVLCERSATAHPGHAPRRSIATTLVPEGIVASRKWVMQDPSDVESGSFVMERNGVVQIRREDDSLVAIPVAMLSQNDRDFVEQRVAQIREAVEQPVFLAQAERRGPGGDGMPKTSPLIARHFDPFVKLKAIRTRWDDSFFYVESNGIPDHPMMIGITSWQQQVPIPQKYFGDNAWQIPLHPIPAKRPASTKNRFLRGAIAVAVNGVPIFNPLNNRGDDAYLFGELDEYGGHCGRADDYHYHLAPVHLEKNVGKGEPIAYALDGYPIYGYQDSQAPDFAPLDSLNGHKDAHGNYHYHATKTYPYLNGGFYGEVIERDGQVDPQPRAEPLRPALQPLRDAKITDFKETKPGSYRLTYDVRGKQGTVSYTRSENGSTTFEFVDTNGRKTTETYTPRRGGPGGRGGPPPRRDDGRQPPRLEPRR